MAKAEANSTNAATVVRTFRRIAILERLCPLILLLDFKLRRQLQRLATRGWRLVRIRAAARIGVELGAA